MNNWFIRRANIVAGGSSPTPPAPTEADLTSLFTWTNGTYGRQGGTSSSSVMRRSDLVDVSSYQGKTMKVTWLAYNSSSGGQIASYGLFFYDSNDAIIGSSTQVPLATGYPNSSGYSIDDYEVSIPSNAVKFKTVYFRTTVSFTISTFSCKVVL